MNNFDEPEDNIPVFRSERGTGTVTHRKYRKDKRHQKSIKITVQEDLGTIEQTQEFFFKGSTQRTTTKKERNPELIYLMKAPIRIGYYKNSKKVFVWQMNGIFSGELEKHDLKQLFSKFGLILRGETPKEENYFGSQPKRSIKKR